MMKLFRDRRDAGRQLAAKLSDYAGRSDLLVLALPRGGVPVGYEVARALSAPLDVFIVRKLGAPDREELAIGALASGGVTVLNHELVRRLRVTQPELDEIVSREAAELRRREALFRPDRPSLDLKGRTIILVDDGLATGSTMYAAVIAIRRQKPTRLIVAVPVSVAATCDHLRPYADEVICARTPEPFYAVGLWYEDFTQTTDEEVRELLQLSTPATA
jgi:putative phosphoribosyl transferase